MQCVLLGLCPACGARGLFAGVIRFSPRCRSCGLDFQAFAVDDGPAAFVTLVAGGLILGLGLWLEMTWAPPLWVHLLIWPIITLGAVLLSLRWAKAGLLVAEYRNAAHEGRLAPRDDDT